MRAVSKFILCRLLGWHFRGRFPDLDRCVVAVAPHTSWVDFPLGLLVRSTIGIRINYVGKKSLFRPPFGWLFRWTGGAPVDRSKKSDTVQAVADIFRQRKVFRLALAPEGTRKKVDRWRSGFYYIAVAAGVPIVLVAFDYGKKEIAISEPYWPSGDFERDYPEYRKFFVGVKGYIPEYS